jgi:hypothetical protein
VRACNSSVRVCVTCSDHIYQLRQAQLLRGHDLSGIWRVSGMCSNTKQQVAIRMLVEHDVNSGNVTGGHVPGDPVEFAFENGRIVGDQMHWTQVFLDGQQVVSCPPTDSSRQLVCRHA